MLVIDLDPQSNASFMLLSRDGLENWRAARRTLQDLLLDEQGGKVLPYSSYIVPHASDLVELQHGSRRGRIGLLPSVPAMWALHYEFDKVLFGAGKEPVEERARILESVISSAGALYTTVLIDCPPGFGSLSRAGLRVSDHVISPTILDPVSVRSLKDFVDIGLVKTLGLDVNRYHHVIVSKFQPTNHQKRLLDLVNQQFRLLLPAIPLKNSMLDVTDHLHGVRRNYDQKYAIDVSKDINSLCNAIDRATS